MAESKPPIVVGMRQTSREISTNTVYNYNSGGGIIIQPTGSGSARVEISRTIVRNNTYGIFANGTGSTGLIAVQIRDSVVSGSTFNGGYSVSLQRFNQLAILIATSSEARSRARARLNTKA